ncbi:MAG TPA: DUF87 domain-containing protein [Candidatus Paceibacterota bacterium]|nr:DUF87 domain-containing protein [Candidatus Paceibacterota bacterium]
MQFDPEKVTYFARTDARGKNVPFGIKAKDRQRHVYVIGKTGMGKSTLLENMAVQDIQNGEGMAFIDPHGSAAETLLNYIPQDRVNDVLYFAPFDTEHPVSFNIMEDIGADKRHLVVSGLMSVFEKIWVDAWSARMAYILQNTLMALLEFPGATLLGVNRMLSDKDYRKLVVDNVKDPGVKAFWVDEFAKYNERYMQEAGDAIKNKIGQFTANPVIRNIIGQPKSSFDIRKMMDEKKILIMNLSKGLIGETNANLLGSMLTTRIYLAAMSRADLPPEKMREMPNFYFYVDEFQSFANATFANILSEARKYHLNLTIAHQYIEQMEEEVRNAVFGNVGTIISFRVGPFDAEVLETIFSPQFTATDIVNLAFAQVYLTLMIDGIGSQPFSATTLPPIAPPTISCKDMVVAASREKFTKVRADVEVAIRKFHEPVNPPAPKERAEARPAPREGMQTKPQGERQGGERPRQSAPERERQNAERPREQREVPKSDAKPVESKPAEAPKESHRQQHPKPHRDGPHDRDRRHVDEKQHRGNVDELRSVLKKIVSTAPSDVPAERRNVAKSEELKEALSVAMGEPKPAPKEEPKPAPQTSPAEEATSAPKAAPTPEPPRPKQKGVTPKELERMMRLTTEDKPPL